jgi:hypothetical protein
MVDHGHKNDSVEVGKVNVGVSLTDMLVDDELFVGKKDGILPSTASDGQAAKIMVDHGHKNDSVEVGKVNVGVSLTDMLVDEELFVGKKDGILLTASDGQAA